MRKCLVVRLGAGLVATGDLCSGWRIREMLLANPPEGLARIRAYLAGMNRQDPERLGESTVVALRGGGTFRVLSREDADNLEGFRQSATHRLYYAPMGITDRLWVGAPVSAEVDSAFIFESYDRSGRGPFTAEDKARCLPPWRHEVVPPAPRAGPQGDRRQVTLYAPPNARRSPSCSPSRA